MTRPRLPTHFNHDPNSPQLPPPSTITDLPDELLTQIFSYVNLDDLCQLLFVSKRFYTILNPSSPYSVFIWKAVRIRTGYPDPANRDLSEIEFLKRVRSHACQQCGETSGLPRIVWAVFDCHLCDECRTKSLIKIDDLEELLHENCYRFLVAVPYNYWDLQTLAVKKSKIIVDRVPTDEEVEEYMAISKRYIAFDTAMITAETKIAESHQKARLIRRGKIADIIRTHFPTLDEEEHDDTRIFNWLLNTVERFLEQTHDEFDDYSFDFDRSSDLKTDVITVVEKVFEEEAESMNCYRLDDMLTPARLPHGIPKLQVERSYFMKEFMASQNGLASKAIFERAINDCIIEMRRCEIGLEWVHRHAHGCSVALLRDMVKTVVFRENMNMCQKEQAFVDLVQKRKEREKIDEKRYLWMRRHVPKEYMDGNLMSDFERMVRIIGDSSVLRDAFDSTRNKNESAFAEIASIIVAQAENVTGKIRKHLLKSRLERYPELGYSAFVRVLDNCQEFYCEECCLKSVHLSLMATHCLESDCLPNDIWLNVPDSLVNAEITYGRYLDEHLSEYTREQRNIIAVLPEMYPLKDGSGLEFHWGEKTAEEFRAYVETLRELFRRKVVQSEWIVKYKVGKYHKDRQKEIVSSEYFLEARDEERFQKMLLMQQKEFRNSTLKIREECLAPLISQNCPPRILDDIFNSDSYRLFVQYHPGGSDYRELIKKRERTWQLQQEWKDKYIPPGKFKLFHSVRQLLCHEAFWDASEEKENAFANVVKLALIHEREDIEFAISRLRRESKFPDYVLTLLELQPESERLICNSYCLSKHRRLRSLCQVIDDIIDSGCRGVIRYKDYGVDEIFDIRLNEALQRQHECQFSHFDLMVEHVGEPIESYWKTHKYDQNDKVWNNMWEAKEDFFKRCGFNYEDFFNP